MNADDLREWRHEHGLTAVALADLLHVHPLTVSAWETGRSTIPPFLALALEALAVRLKR